MGGSSFGGGSFGGSARSSSDQAGGSSGREVSNTGDPLEDGLREYLDESMMEDIRAESLADKEGGWTSYLSTPIIFASISAVFV